MQQRTEDWYKAKIGKVGASRIADLMATTKSGYAASRDNYMAELIVARLTGVYPEGYKSVAMQWGIDNEPLAIAAYEFRNDAVVDPVGFVPHPSISDAGASPDGRISTDGLIEVKCPNTATHIDTILTGRIDSKYMKQMQFQMACDNRQWCDFVSFDPRMPVKLQYWQKRIGRDEKMIKEIEQAVIQFLGELVAKIQQLEKVAA